MVIQKESVGGGGEEEEETQMSERVQHVEAGGMVAAFVSRL